MATGGNGNNPGNEVNVYEFDAENDALTLVATTTHDGEVFSVNWSPDGNFLAIGGAQSTIDGAQIRIYAFDSKALSLTLVASQIYSLSTNIVSSVNWSPNGEFLAIGGNLTTSPIIVYQFDPIALTLTQIATQSNGGVGANSVNWTSDGRFLAAGGSNTQSITIYEFNLTTLTLSQVAFSINSNVLSVDWSPDGNFLASGNAISGSPNVIIYNFNRMTKTLNEVASMTLTSTTFGQQTVTSVNWSPDQRFLALSVVQPQQFSSPPNPNILIFEFDQAAGILILRSSNNNIIEDNVLSINWSPLGRLIAAGTNIFDSVYVYLMQDFPFNDNIISSNCINGITGGGKGAGLMTTGLETILNNLSVNSDIDYAYPPIINLDLQQGFDIVPILNHIDADVDEALTLLNTLTLCCSNLTNTLSTCCTDLKNIIAIDFASTWTILTDIKNTITIDFAGTWTILTDIKIQ